MSKYDNRKSGYGALSVTNDNKSEKSLGQVMTNLAKADKFCKKTKKNNYAKNQALVVKKRANLELKNGKKVHIVNGSDKRAEIAALKRQNYIESLNTVSGRLYARK